jgi:hypothetical protein
LDSVGVASLVHHGPGAQGRRVGAVVGGKLARAILSFFVWWAFLVGRVRQVDAACGDNGNTGLIPFPFLLLLIRDGAACCLATPSGEPEQGNESRSREGESGLFSWTDGRGVLVHVVTDDRHSLGLVLSHGPEDETSSPTFMRWVDREIGQPPARASVAARSERRRRRAYTSVVVVVVVVRATVVVMVVVMVVVPVRFVLALGQGHHDVLLCERGAGERGRFLFALVCGGGGGEPVDVSWARWSWGVRRIAGEPVRVL